jgi:hypothetical protein
MLRKISVLVVALWATSYAFAATPSIGATAAHNQTTSDSSIVLGSDASNLTSSLLGPSMQSKALVAGFSNPTSAAPPSCTGPL